MGRRGRSRCVRRLRLSRGSGEGAALNRGDVYDVEIPGGPHPAVVVTRDHAVPVLKNVCIAAITSTVRELPTEVPVGREQGLRRDSVVNCDNLFTVPKRTLGTRRGALGPEQLDRLRTALRIALDLE